MAKARAEVKRGDKVKDPLTGAIGIAYCIQSYLYGCDRVGIQMPIIKRKEDVPLIPDLWFVDESQLEIIQRGAVASVDYPEKSVKKKGPPGGPSGFGPSGNRDK